MAKIVIGRQLCLFYWYEFCGYVVKQGFKHDVIVRNISQNIMTGFNLQGAIP